MPKIDRETLIKLSTSSTPAAQTNHQSGDYASDESLASIGDEDAFNEIFLRHKRRVSHIVGRFFRHPEKAEDLVQEIFTKLYFALEQYRPKPGKNFASWLSSIAINYCYDELRRMRRKRETIISEITANEKDWLNEHWQDGSNASENSLIARDLAEKLLAELEAEDRLILTLLDAEGMSVTEIAQSLKWSESKVKVRAHRARASLRKILLKYL